MPWSMRACAVFLILATFPIEADSGGQSDLRTFSRVTHRSLPPREVSVYVELRPAVDSPDVLLVPLWDELSLRLSPLRHVDVKEGVFAYSVRLLSDKIGDQPLLPINQPRRGITADVIAAFHFRNRENSGPNAPGPLNLNAPGEFRIVSYPGVDLEIRILAFEIVNATPGVVPSFSELSILITAREASAA